jgi:ATP-dependent RNA helicase SUPV3L1/SUV3
MPGGGFTVIPDMMSLVGCSGEEFSGVLRALGFQAEERRVPVEPKAAAADAESTPAAADATESASDPVLEATGDPEVPAPAEPDVPAPADLAPAEPDVPAPDEPQVPVPDEPEAPPPADPEATRAPEPQAAGPAETMIQVWWPKDTGPFRKQTRHPNKASEVKPRHNKPRGKSVRGPDTIVRDDKSQDGKPQDDKGADGKPRHRRGRDGKPHEPKQGPGRGNGGREPAPSDSPFAVLAPLKAQLTGRKH